MTKPVLLACQPFSFTCSRLNRLIDRLKGLRRAQCSLQTRPSTSASSLSLASPPLESSSHNPRTPRQRAYLAFSTASDAQKCTSAVRKRRRAPLCAHSGGVIALTLAGERHRDVNAPWVPYVFSHYPRCLHGLTQMRAHTVNEFPFIRVDNFDGDTNCYGKKPHFYLLTHAHTDHIRGAFTLSLIRRER